MTTVVLVVIRLKQGLQEGMLSEWSRWWRPKEQDTTSVESSGRIFINIKQGSKVAVEESIVALSWERPRQVLRLTQKSKWVGETD